MDASREDQQGAVERSAAPVARRDWRQAAIIVVSMLWGAAALYANFLAMFVATYVGNCNPASRGCHPVDVAATFPWVGLIAGVLVTLVMGLKTGHRRRWVWLVALAAGIGVHAMSFAAVAVLLS